MYLQQRLLLERGLPVRADLHRQCLLAGLPNWVAAMWNDLHSDFSLGVLPAG